MVQAPGLLCYLYFVYVYAAVVNILRYNDIVLISFFTLHY